ncbi:MAG: PAS domain S-box protein [Nitratireductor sp.]|nr:PAS domain S-box protein [Nitratireductor sp.]
MISLVMLTAIGVGTVIHRGMMASGLPQELDRMRAHAGLVADEFRNHIEIAREDVQAIAGMPAVVRLAALHAEAHPGEDIEPERQLRTELAGQFLAILQAKKNYLRLRLIGTTDGMEIVRVSRKTAGTAASITPQALLQSKAHRPYFSASFDLGDGEIHVSPIDYIREHRAIKTPNVPAIRLAVAVRSDDGVPLALTIINMDMRPLFQQLRDETPKKGYLFLVDEAGNYLVHPDTSKEFGFETGKPFRLQDDWPGLAGPIASKEPTSLQVQDKAGLKHAAAIWPVELADTRSVAIAEIVPVQVLMEQASTIAGSTVNVAAIAALVSGMVAVAIGISFSRPLRHVTTALNAPSRHQPIRLPVKASGEIGALARAFYGYLERESLLSAIVNSSFDAITTETLDGVITSWNPAAEKLYGYAADEAIGANACMVIPSEHVEEMQELRARAVRGEKVQQFESIRIDRDGGRHEVALTLSPVKDPKHEIIGVSVIARDITHEREMDRRMLALKSQAEHAKRVSTAGKMASAMVHELGQPLTVIGNFITSAEQMLKGHSMQPHQNALQLMERAGEQTRHARDVLVRLREFIGNRSTQLELHNLNDIVEAGLQSALIGADGHNLKVVRDYEEQLPKVPVDKTQVRQVVVNLVRNAIEAMAACDKRILTVATRDRGDEIDLIVADTGPGIDPDIRDRLFDPFVSTKAGGMGIGLPLSHAIVEAHGGRMSIESNEGGGNLFKIALRSAHV